jgi:hypothetical protein
MTGGAPWPAGEGAQQGDGFLAAIARLGLGELDQEPRRLQESLQALDEELVALSVSHYEVHLHNARARQVARTRCADSMRRGHDIGGSLAALQGGLKKFKGLGQRLADAHARNGATLDKQGQLLELLELPQLMDTCARNGLYDEALDVTALASTLQRRHRTLAELGAAAAPTAAPAAAPGGEGAGEGAGAGVGREAPGRAASEASFRGGVRIVESLAGDVFASSALMRQQLLQQLRQKVSLPECLRLVGFLRRLDAQERGRAAAASAAGPGASAQAAAAARTGEVRLRCEFLECRDAYVASLAVEEAGRERARPYTSALRLIERCRVHWFDVVTQYRAIFSSGESPLLELSEDDGILARWVAARVADLVAQLESQLAAIDDFGSVAALLEQATKFGMSLARLGADFRALLAQPFQRRAVQVMAEYWAQAVEQAERQLAAGDWGEPFPAPPTGTEDAASELAPPQELLEFPVLAELLNVVLSSLNELRQCPAPVLAVELGCALAAALARLAAALTALAALPHLPTAHSSQPATSPDRFERLCSLTAHKLLPYLQLCLDTVFDRASFAQIKTFCDVRPLVQEVLKLCRPTAGAAPAAAAVAAAKAAAAAAAAIAAAAAAGAARNGAPASAGAPAWAGAPAPAAAPAPTAPALPAAALGGPPGEQDDELYLGGSDDGWGGGAEEAK